MLLNYYKTKPLMRCRYLSLLVPLSSIVALLTWAAIAPGSYADAVHAMDNNLDSGIAPLAIDAAGSSASLIIGNGSVNEFSNAGTSTDVIEIGVPVTVRTNLIDSYTLQISGNPTLDGSTTVNAVTAETETLPDGSWGYKWNNADKYRGVASTATILENTKIAAADGIVDNTKTLTFAAKFSDQAEAGHYRTDVKLSLIANPKKVAEIGEWTLPDGTIKASGITTMQEMTPAICEQVSTPIASEVITSGKAPIMQLRDTRDESVYAIARYPDGRCWMAQNLAIMGDRTLTSADSNVSSSYNLPASNVSSFNTSDTAQAVYLGADSKGVATGYYTWCAATAGTCSSSALDKDIHAASSICPKGWRLPGGYADKSYGNEFFNLFLSIVLTTSADDLVNFDNAYSTLITGDKTAVQNLPYNFGYTGYAREGAFLAPVYNALGGYWWSGTQGNGAGSGRTLELYYSSDHAALGTMSVVGYYGYAVRCVAADPDLTEISTMQEMTPRVCEKSATGATNTLTDTRDGSKYSIRKMADGKCWMNSNLVLTKEGMEAKDVSELNSSNSNLSEGETYTLPASSISGFSSDTAVNAYYTTESSAGATGYYTWCAATAGTCSSATSSGQHAPSSICPKGWRLPGGYNDATYGNEFYNLFNSMELGIALGTSGSTNWTSTQLNIAQNSNYNFTYTGLVLDSSFLNGTSLGYWWSSTAGSSTYAYYANVNSSNVHPGTYNSYRRYGFAVRCVAQ